MYFYIYMYLYVYIYISAYIYTLETNIRYNVLLRKMNAYSEDFLGA